MDNDGICVLQLLEMALSFVLEDFVETGLQYFYLEKFSFMKGDVLVYFNAAFMIFKAMVLTIRISIALIESVRYRESFRFSFLEAFFNKIGL